MKTSLVFFILCAFAGAMVSRDRRALNSEELLRVTRSSSTTEKPSQEQKPQQFCAPHTPCAWSFYKPTSKIIETNITNTYCICSPDKECQMSEEDTTAKAFVYRCRPVTDAEETDAEEEAAQS